MNERLQNNIEKTIGHVSRQIRRSGEVDSKMVVALARLVRSYSSFLERTQEKEWDYENYGDPHFHDSLMEGVGEERRKRREREAAEELGIDPDSLEDREEEEDDEAEADEDEDENGNEEDD